MNILNSLKLVASTAAPRVNGVQRQRNKLAAKLDEQIDMVKAKQKGVAYTPTKLKTITNPSSGQKILIEGHKRVRPWFWVTGADGYCFNVRYGSQVVALGKGKNAVEVTDINALVEALSTVKQAVLVGELDAEIEKASGALRSGFKKEA